MNEISLLRDDGTLKTLAEVEDQAAAALLNLALARSRTASEACDKIGLSRSTAYRHAARLNLSLVATAPKRDKATPETRPRQPRRHISKTESPAPAIVSDLSFLEAKARRDQKWPPERDAKLRELYGMRLAPAVIALDMGCAEQEILRRLAKLGLRASAYAQERESA